MDGRSPVDFETTEKLRQFAEDFQDWGDGATPLFSIIRNSKCDKGTALYIFWLSDPVSFFELYENEEEALAVGVWSRDYYRLLVEIQENYVAGFYVESDFCVNPEEEASGEFTSDTLKTRILDVMRKSSCYSSTRMLQTLLKSRKK